MRIGFVCTLVLFVAVELACSAERPNIVLLIADDLGYGELGCQGNDEIPTPHIDSIARNGVRFTDGYVTAPFCSASRAGLMTGRYQTRFGYEFNPIGAANENPEIGLPTSQQTLAMLLRNQGYATALIGKWHLGGTAAYHPIRHGFDEFFGFLHEGHYFVPPPYENVTTMLRRKSLPDGTQGRWQSDNGQLVLSTHMGHHEPAYDADNPILRDSQPVAESEYLTDAFTREAVSFIGRHRERPFFLCLAYNAVHSPLQGAKPYMEKFQRIKDVHRRIFAAMLANLDDSVGDVLEALDEHTLTNNTLVVFLSDNGGPTRELTSSNLPLRSGKGSVYEGGIRVPFMMQWPSQIQGGQTSQAPVISLDVFATVESVVTGTTRTAPPCDGVNLLELLNHDQTRDRELFWRIGNRKAMRLGNWKLVQQPPRGSQAKPLWELYNLKEDLSEQNNLANEQPDRLAELIARWETMNSDMIDPLW